ncbi:DUF1292 domain-containing protein [Pectinatus brassicae]|uniref:Uncharacterized protein YrzB (UPF0473 family) n=1 Tax=Pectinatus brassicae TaxID=862415 RepID=A0A840USY8_9FIRM|nr:DUF1292 domain-containing protein [Pectinatus brassicae]MBB5336073.1 uncharacterized protein YrzB (UPF0473 family) [Pectinatus brassicae]
MEDNQQNEKDIIEMVDEDDQVHYFYEEMQFEVDGKRYALLSAVGEDEELTEDDNTIVRVIVNDEGEEEYYSPDDDEFDKAVEAYEKLMDE